MRLLYKYRLTLTILSLWGSATPPPLHVNWMWLALSSECRRPYRFSMSCPGVTDKVLIKPAPLQATSHVVFYGGCSIYLRGRSKLLPRLGNACSAWQHSLDSATWVGRRRRLQQLRGCIAGVGWSGWIGTLFMASLWLCRILKNLLAQILLSVYLGI